MFLVCGIRQHRRLISNRRPTSNPNTTAVAQTQARSKASSEVLARNGLFIEESQTLLDRSRDGEQLAGRFPRPADTSPHSPNTSQVPAALYNPQERGRGTKQLQ